MDHYDLLRVTHDASAEEIKKSYQKLVLQFHPDKVSKFVQLIRIVI